MAEGEENPIGAIALESRLVEGPGYTDDSAAKPVARKKKNTRKRRHGESTESIKLILIILACWRDFLTTEMTLFILHPWFPVSAGGV